MQYSSTLRSFVPVVQAPPMQAAYHQAVASGSLPQAQGILAAAPGGACYSPVQLQLQQVPGLQLLYAGGPLPQAVQYGSAMSVATVGGMAAPAVNGGHFATQHLTTSHYLLPSMSAPMQQHLSELLVPGAGGTALALQQAQLPGLR